MAVSLLSPVRSAVATQLTHLLEVHPYQIITLAGEAGVGKSHLIREHVHAHAPIAGKFDTGKDTTLAYAAFIQAIRHALNHLLSLPEAEFACWQRRLQQEVPFAPLVAALPELVYFQPPLAHASPLTQHGDTFSDTLSLTRPFERAFLSVWRCLTASLQAPRFEVIWLDDVQWMDTASAGFLEMLLQQDLPVHWILSGRNTDFVTALLRRMARPQHTHIVLHPFSEAETLTYVQNSLGGTRADCEELAGLLYSLSHGFPLELAWSLKEWQQQQKLVNQQGWKYTGSLTDLLSADYKGWEQLMHTQWQRLPEDVQEMLQTAALLGPKFSRQDLKHIQLAATDFDRAWDRGLASGFLMVGQGDETQFSHDRLYEWVRGLFDPEHKAQTHLKIARQLLTSARASHQLALMVEQLNACAHLLQPHEQALRITQNLTLVRQMLAQGAVTQAQQLLLGLEGDISPDSPHWENFRVLQASQAYLANDMVKAETLLQDLLQRAPQGVLEAQLLLIVIYTQHNRYEEAVVFALSLLEAWGLHLNTDPEHLTQLFTRSYAALCTRSPEALIACAHAPSSPAFEAQMKVIATATAALYNYDPELYGHCVLHAIDCIFQGQGTSRTAILYAAASILVVHQTGDLERASTLIHCAETLAQQHGREDDLTLIHCVMGEFIAPWKGPYATARDYLTSSWEAGLRSGNLQFAGYTGVFRGANLFLDAHPLQAMSENVLPDLIDFNQRIQNFSPLDGLTGYVFLIAKLRQGVFATPERSEADFIADLYARESNADRSRYLTYKACVLLLFGEDEAAYAALQASDLATYLPASISRVWHLLLTDILHWRLQLTPPPEPILPFSLETLAHNNPGNFEVLYHIWRAEHPDGDPASKLQAYHQAVQAARQHAAWHWEGFALEGMARLQQQGGLEVLAQQCLLGSIAAYQQWGASAKVSQLVNQLSPYYHSQYSLQHEAISTDVAEILKICADFAKILAPEALQRHILEVLKAHTEAAHIELLLSAQGGTQWPSFSLSPTQPNTLQAVVSSVPQLLLNYVARTQKSVMLPTHREIFNTSEIHALQGKHVLLPLVFQQSLMGIVYFQPTTANGYFGFRAELLLQALGGFLAGVLHNAQRAQNLEELIAQHTSDLQRANLRLSQLLEERQHVLAIAAHDLKHPLGTLKLGISMLEQMEQELSAEVRAKAFENLHQTLDDMNQNTERLLLVEQLESQLLTPQWKKAYLLKALQPTLQSYAWKAREKQQTLVLNGFEQDVLVETDTGMLRLILSNLVENAIKFSPFQTTVAIRLLLDAHSFQIQVSDQGPGFGPAEQQKLFTKFGRLLARPTAGESSHGLGLFIVKQLVTALNGVIGVSSTPQVGSTFSLKFNTHVSQSS